MDEKTDLYNRYKNLAYKLASRFYRRLPHAKDDLISAANEGLCSGIKDVLEKNKSEFAGAIIYLHIKRYIFEEIRNIPLVPVPQSYINKKKLEALEEKKSFCYKELYPIILRTEDSLKISSNGFYYTIFREYIEALKLNEEDLKILQFRIEGRTIPEIAKEINKSVGATYNRIKKIQKAWRKQCQ